MDDDEKSKNVYELKKQLKYLKAIRGSGTELISLYMTPSSQVSDYSGKLKDEYGQASNIKSKQTRGNVQDALMKIIQHLKTFRTTPDNGMAIFCGNVSRDAGRPDIRLFQIVPHEPLRTGFYRCDSTFVLEPLEEIISIKDNYGLLVMDGREATIAILRGRNTRVLRRLTSTAHAKVRKGGQSARRYERLIEENIELYYKRIGAALDEIFVGMPNLKGIIVGGPGPAKEDFAKMAPYNYQLKVLGVLDTGYTDDYGVKELTDKSENVIAGQETIREKKLVDSFIREVVRGGLAAYGMREVEEALNAGKVATLLVSEDLDWKRITYKCSKCGEEVEKLGRSAEESDHSCGGRMKPISDVEIAGELLKIAEERGVKVEMVSTDTSEGAQFMNSFFGVGAFLRY